MRELKMMLHLDGKVFGIGSAIEKDAKIKDFEEALDEMSTAMLRVIKKEYFNEK